MILRPGTYLQDRYEVLEQIGSGGMSDVYKAMCHKLNRLVAIKVLKEEFSQDSGFVSKFQLEAQAAGRLSHPNIVNVFDVVDEGSIHYIVMELIEGITLKNYIAKKGALEGKEAVGIGISVAQGIAAAHEQGIVHRDIKPQNIIIAKDGKVKVADFGIAKAVSAETLNVNAVGSVHYISPEQARGGYSDTRSDIYSLGITMYEMVTGRVPFEGDNTVTIALAHLEDPITPPGFYNEDVPLALENIILKCTEKKPEYRYGTMTEVISDLRKALANPDGDFVRQAPRVNDSDTLIISQPELVQIRSGQRNSGKTAVVSGSLRKPKKKEEENIGIEKLLTAAGIAAALLVVIVLIIVFAKVGGFFRSGSRKELSGQEASTEETLSDKQVRMPGVLGLGTEIAGQKLKEGGGLYLKVKDYVFSDTVDEGDIVSQEPEEGAVTDKYSAVYVVVSKGPEHAAIDLSLLGLEKMEQAAAKALLEKKGLVVAEDQKNSDSIKEGMVLAYSPLSVKEGDTVTLTVSLGPELANPAQVPDIKGQFEEIAVEMLADNGLVKGSVTEETSETAEKGTVLSQSLLPGTKVEAGTAVNYVLCKGSAKEEQYKYLASIDKTYSLQNIIGPGSSSTSLTVKVQLRQSVNGKDEVTELMAPVTMTGDQILPVVFKKIEGAYGVTSGTVEIVNVDTGDVINSYLVTFVPVPR